MKTTPEVLKWLGEQFPDFKPIDRKLCNQCGAECCDRSTPFAKEDIDRIKAKYRKLFRGIKILPSHGDAFMLLKRDNKQCVFLDEKKQCKVYDLRPQICKDFGDKPYSLCAYNGCDSIPTDPKEVKRLAEEAQLNSYKLMAKMGGHSGHVNALDAGCRNVLAPDYQAIGKVIN